MIKCDICQEIAKHKITVIFDKDDKEIQFLCEHDTEMLLIDLYDQPYETILEDL